MDLEVFWTRGLGGLWHPVATCGALWQPVAACGGLWHGSPYPYIKNCSIDDLIFDDLIIRSSSLEAWRHAWADNDAENENEDAEEGFDWRNSHTLEL